MKSINVLIITYKQQDLIKRALDSILIQKDYGLNKIIVNDDCSPDNTWDVLEDYKNKYPSILEIHKNDKNLGIYGNWNKMVDRRGEAEVYYLMAGDDALCEGVLARLQQIIKNENIDCSEPIALYFDWKHVKPDGRERIIKNDAVSKNKDIFGLKLRNRISNRSCFVSKGIMDQYEQIDLSIGISLAETLADMQYSRLAKMNYYDNQVGSVYYAGIGVSTSLFKKEYYEESIEANKKLLDLYKIKGRDRMWIESRIYYNLIGIKPSFSNVAKTLFYYLIGVKYGPIKKIFSELMDIVKLIKK